jgi:hypothetical protein
MLPGNAMQRLRARLEMWPIHERGLPGLAAEAAIDFIGV